MGTATGVLMVCMLIVGPIVGVASKLADADKEKARQEFVIDSLRQERKIERARNDDH